MQRPSPSVPSGKAASPPVAQAGGSKRVEEILLARIMRREIGREERDGEDQQHDDAADHGARLGEDAAQRTASPIASAAAD